MTPLFRPAMGPWLCGVTAFWCAACSPSGLVDVAPPSTVVDPSVVTTSSGAKQLYNTTLTLVSMAFGGGGDVNNIVQSSGLFTDEVMVVGTGQQNADLDRRFLSVTGTACYGYCWPHQIRNQALQTREALTQYATDAPKAWQGQLYAFEAYAIVWLAEFYCSGLPLTHVPLSGSPELTRGFSTQELLEQAIVYFDSAIVAGADSARFVNLAKVGKARALLSLGRVSEAATAVQNVPTDFTYVVTFNPNVTNEKNGVGFGNPKTIQVVDGEGGNGLVWSIDPRTAVGTAPAVSGAMRVTGKYSVTSAGTIDVTASIADNPMRMADGLEARLIEAEAALAAGNASWLTTLNTLRSSCIGTAPCAPLPGLTAVNLPLLADPGSASARVDLLFKERAMWLYLTGHRQGDLRRLVRTYHRDPNALWPMGTYLNAGFPPLVGVSRYNGTAYDTRKVLFFGNTVEAGNALYQGCFNEDP